MSYCINLMMIVEAFDWKDFNQKDECALECKEAYNNLLELHGIEGTRSRIQELVIGWKREDIDFLCDTLKINL